MKLYLTFAALLLSASLLAQPCKRVDIATTPQQKMLIREYLQECRQKRYFFEDKGIVTLTIYQDAKGRTCWLLSAMIDDRYRANPLPEQYAFVAHDVFLVYKGDSTGRVLSMPTGTTERDKCLQEIIGSRVYERSTKKQFMYVQEANGQETKYPVTHQFNGNHWNEQIIRFNRDGTVTKFLLV